MKRHYLLSSISFRLLVFNLLILIFPIASFLFLNTYEEQLLQYLEHALVQQGRIAAAALSGQEEQLRGKAEEILRNMEKKHDARFRILDRSGAVLADSSVLPSPTGTADTREPPETSGYRKIASETTGEGIKEEASPPRERFLYRLASLPVRLLRNYLLPPAPPIESGDFYKGEDRLFGREVQAALEGRYGAATRISSGGQISVTLYSALPIESSDGIDGGGVVGVVLVSQSSYRILQDLYNLRLDIFKIFLLSLLATILISIFLSLTISRPLKKLSLKARNIFTPGGKLEGRFLIRGGRDEIGKLSTSLDKLTERLKEHIAFIESFASDVSHELKNPIAVIRSSAEVAGEIAEGPAGGTGKAENTEEIRRFLSVIQRESARMERLISSIRDISTIDTRLDDEKRERIDLGKLIESIIDGYRLRNADKNVHFTTDLPEKPVYMVAAPERVVQILTNLIDNGVSFSPAGGTVSVALSPIEAASSGNTIRISVSDEGGGFPEEIKEKIFTRFFTYREGNNNALGNGPDNKDLGHTGLGLSIVKAIVEGYGGSITAENIPAGGARFTVILPAGAQRRAASSGLRRSF